MSSAIVLACNALVKPFEGYHKRLPDGSCQAYPDPATGSHPWTIGYGSTGPGIAPGTIWTAAQAENALQVDLARFEAGVINLSPNIVREPARRLAALISFAYNCGLGNYRISTLRKRVIASDWDGAATEILKWNKAAGRVLPGLTRRRQAESILLR